MTRPWGLFLLLLTIAVALVTSIDPAKNRVNILRPFKSVKFSDANMRQCLWFAMQEYNKESEDEYIFLVSQIQLAQMQITDHMEYIIEVEIARSNCRKPLNNNENCIIQTNSNLEKVTDSLEYYFEAKIARTMCKKAAGENEHCLFQKNPTMQKEVFCIFVVRSKPWKFELSMLKKLCRDA
ncbi:Cystatin-8 [Fukomys damarensis]|uniref:Cystatin-8 n=1 Tax=Fukomys damarensis TaxID=885580 RepID=A0A091CRH1_FUKDA|nr:Cystatin-8 [Fukomys damarensis]